MVIKKSLIRVNQHYYLQGVQLKFFWLKRFLAKINQRERFYIENNECVNKYIPGRTKKEWTEVNKEKIAEYQKGHREDHKEHIKEQMKEYQEANKEAIAEKRAEKITCECGATISRGSKSGHLKSKKHLKYSGGLSSN